jgi:zinc protease
VIPSVEAMRFRFPNGLRLVVIEDHSAPTFAYQTWYDVGSRDEEPGKTGLAHLFEHMMFKGTKAVPDGEFDRIVDEAGAEGQNAYTTQDHTTYIEELPKERLELIMKLEADRMRNLVVNDQSFATEREVVQNERRYRNENSPEGMMYQEIYGLAFTKQAYRWPVIGFAEDLARMSSADARAFYEAHYSPNHAVVVVSGDVKAREVRDLVAKYYSVYPRVDAPAPARELEPEQKSPRRKTLRLNVQVEKLLMAYPIPAMDNEDMPALDIIQMLLSGGRSSRLQKALVESGIATDAYGYAADARDPSLFLLGASMQDKMKAILAEKVILRELVRLGNEEVPQLELERARNLLSFEFFSGLESNSAKAHYLGHYESQLGGVEKGLELHQKRLAVTAAQVRDAARRYFPSQKRSVIVGLKKTAGAAAGEGAAR